MLSATLDIYGRKLSPGAYSIWFECMKQYPLDACREALSKHVQGGKSSAPVPSDIVGILQSDDGHPGAEEAWAIVASALDDEGVTVVMTAQIAQAFGVALLLNDDAIAARMAFKESYNRAISVARAEGTKPTWFPSLGQSAAGREGVLLEAVRLGRLTQERVHQLLPHKPLPLADGLEIKRIEGRA